MIEQVLSGEPWQFDVLVKRYERRIFLATLTFLRNHQDAEDATQEVFVSAFKRLESFQGRSSFLTWLRRIAFNQCVDQRRKSQLRKTTSLEIESSDPLEVAKSPQETVETNELIESIQKSIDSLPEEQRGIIILRDLDGLDYSEIAEILGIPIGTVRSRLHRARCELKLIMENRGVGLMEKVSSPKTPIGVRGTSS